MDHKPIHVFDFNGTLVNKELGSVCERYIQEKVFEPLFGTVLQMSAEDWEKKFPEAAAKGLSQKEVHDRLLPIIANPPKYTEARKGYYDLMEGEMRNGRIDAGLHPDVLSADSAL